MREIRKSGSEGGGARERSPYPYGSFAEAIQSGASRRTPDQLAGLSISKSEISRGANRRMRWAVTPMPRLT